MYFNQDLEEVQYFNPRDTIANIFFQIFYDKNFFKKINFLEEEKLIIAKKTVFFKNEKFNISIFFEKSPLIIRKIKVQNMNETITYSILNPNFNPLLDEDFFSLIKMKS